MKMMKTKQKLTALILLFAITGGCKERNENPFSYEELIFPQLQSMNMSRPEDSWNYPVYPGMAEWSRFNTSQEMADACQIPEERLKNMSTQAVIQAIWEYPFFTQPLHRHTYQADFESTFLTNNAYKELTKRTDAGKSLLERLMLVKPLILGAMDMPNALELLFSQTVFLSQLNDKERKTIVGITLKNDNLRQQDTTTGNIFRGTTGLLMGRTMLNAGYLPFVEETGNNEQLETFLKTSSYLAFIEDEEEFMQRIISHGEIFVK
jgi:hypothetical protein